jgi:hypothetical protein
MTAFTHHADFPAHGGFQPFAGKRCIRVAARRAMGLTRGLWGCDPTCDSSLGGGRKREVDSMVEVSGT